MTRAGEQRPSWVGRMEQLEWAKLDYAYGEATNVSELIQTVAFGDEAEACRACSTLHNELVHQGSLYSSTYEAIPFLIGALAVIGSGSGARLRALILLGDIINSAIQWMEMAEEYPDIAAPETPDHWTGKYIERAWLGSELFIRLLHEEDNADVRMFAAYLLGLLLTRGPGSASADPPGRYASAVATLIACLQSNEADELARSSVAFALGWASAHDPALIEHLRHARARPDVGEPTQVAAALAVIQIENGRHANLHEVGLLIDTMCRAAETDTLFQARSGTESERRSPWIMARLRFRLRKALCAWSAGDHDRMERVLPALLTGVRLTSGYAAEVDLGPVFAWLWPDQRTTYRRGPDGRSTTVWPRPITSKDLTGIALRVVQACYNNPSIWEPPVGNTGLAFRHAGLPETRAGLKALLDA